MSEVVNKRILAFGHSHLVAIARAYDKFYGNSAVPRPFEFSSMQMRKDAFQPNIVTGANKIVTGANKRPLRKFIEGGMMLFQQPIVRQDGASAGRVRSLNEAVERHFKQLVQREKPDLIVSCAMGNEYNSFAMLNHPQRFDFYLPSRPDLPTDESAEIIPVDLLEGVIRSRLSKTLSLYLAMTTRHGDCPKIHIPPPPPIRDAAHIEAHPSRFAEKIKKLGVSPAFFRLKMWLLTCEVEKKLCDAAGVIFHDLPKSVSDSDGFLAKAHINRDPTHGNIRYGRVVLDDIARTSFPRLVMEKTSERAPVQESAKPLFLAARS